MGTRANSIDWIYCWLKTPSTGVLFYEITERCGNIKVRQGFTIVELIIAIVVIVILAAISIVAYTGIRNRTEQSANHATIKAYVQAFQIMKAKTGALPTGNNNNSSCLGPEPQPSSCTHAGQTASTTSTANTKKLLAEYGLPSQPGLRGVSFGHLVYSASFYGEPALLWKAPSSQDCVPSPARFRIDPNWVDDRTWGYHDVNVTYCYMSLGDI